MNTYTFQKWENNSYTNEISNLVVLPLTEQYIFDAAGADKLPYTSVAVSSDTELVFDELLTILSLKNFKNELLSILVNLQFQYITYEKLYNEELIKDFKSEDKDYKILLNIVEEYLFNNQNPLKSISFNFAKQTEKKISLIKDHAVMNDILDFVCNGLDITKDNFFTRSQKIIEDSMHIDYGKGGEYIRTIYITRLFKFLKTRKHLKETADNDLLKFIGCFLHISQIPAYSTIDAIQINSAKEEFDSIEVSNMRHYLNRPKNIFTK